MSELVRALILSQLPSLDEAVEVVERKGLGHPDTICDALAEICDALAEALSQALCREYRNRFGAILHHNVDTPLSFRQGLPPPMRFLWLGSKSWPGKSSPIISGNYQL
jgi:hypothetical protein